MVIICSHYYTGFLTYPENTPLKMLGLYLYTLIIGHTPCNMLSIQYKLTLQNELQNCVLEEKVNMQQQ